LRKLLGWIEKDPKQDLSPWDWYTEKKFHSKVNDMMLPLPGPYLGADVIQKRYIMVPGPLNMCIPPSCLL
jgi:hypothetical protein